MIPAFQAWSQPFFGFVEDRAARRAKRRGAWRAPLTPARFRVGTRAHYVVAVAFLACLLPFFGLMLGEREGEKIGFCLLRYEKWVLPATLCLLSLTLRHNYHTSRYYPLSPSHLTPAASRPRLPNPRPPRARRRARLLARDGPLPDRVLDRGLQAAAGRAARAARAERRLRDHLAPLHRRERAADRRRLGHLRALRRQQRRAGRQRDGVTRRRRRRRSE